ncbi:hypothetical protein TNCV_4946241 [Trichonephila clavipes]|nr:hypothetical protein TNCV_4946241 [Trichonephila clavipes]
MTAQRYVPDILQPHVFALMQWPWSHFSTRQFSASHGKGVTRRHTRVSALSLPFLSLPDPLICLQLSISSIMWDCELASHEFEQTRGKVTANMGMKCLKTS